MDIIEGKTKIITQVNVGLVDTKNDITAGDGAKHDILAGKAELATQTTCNVFDLLARRNIPLAYIGRDGPTTFFTRLCTMIPAEVVARAVGTGSYIKRHPEVSDKTRFEKPVVEFFYKTTGRKIGDTDLPCDDPLMLMTSENGSWELFYPNKPETVGKIMRLPTSVKDHRLLRRQLSQCGKLAETVFNILAEAWKEQGGELYDFKLEFGTLPTGEIVVADVIDCDSWRVIWKGKQLSKQGYRDGDDLEAVLSVYRIAANLSNQFSRM